MSRIYFPIHAFTLGDNGQGVASGNIPGQNFHYVHGLQNLSINTAFNLEQFFEIGQSDLYANLENLPDIEVTAEKIMDGYPLIQHLASRTAISATLLGRYNNARCSAVISYYPLTNDAASGVPLSHIYMSGLYVSNIAMNYPLQGAATESVTLVGNHKLRLTPSNFWVVPTGGTTSNSGGDVPSTQINRRQNMSMASSRWPTDLPGITNSGLNTSGVNGFACHIGDVNVSVNMARTDLLEQGRKEPYFRYLNVPIEVTTTINVVPNAGSGDNINADPNVDNLTDQTIIIVNDNDGITVNLGTLNKLQSVTLNGGDVGGGNVTIAYTYTNFNNYTCTATADPAGLM